MAYIRKVYKKAKLLKQGEAQMEVALGRYKNDGTLRVFKPVLPAEESDEEDVARGGIKLLNKFPPGSFMDKMRKDPQMMANMREAMRSTDWTGSRPSAGAPVAQGAQGGTGTSAASNVPDAPATRNALTAPGAGRPTSTPTPTV